MIFVLYFNYFNKFIDKEMIEPNEIINKQYKICNKIGAGSFGAIYLGKYLLKSVICVMF